MDYAHILLTSIGSVVVLFILTKIMGYKQMSQLSMFDYITGITIGSIAAEMATSLEDDFMKPLLAMVVYGVVAWLISFCCLKSFTFRRFVTGKATILYNNGKLYEENFKKAKLELNEFLMMARNGGYFDLSTIDTIILEANGKLSFLQKSTERPATPADLNLTPQQEVVLPVVIEDGRIMHKNLKHAGVNEDWLENKLKEQKTSQKDVFLGICDGNKNLVIYKKTGKEVPGDVLE